MVRLARVSDAEAIRAIYAPHCDSTIVSFEYCAPTAEEMASRLENVLCDLPWLVYEEDGRVVGYAYASKHKQRKGYQWCVDVAVYVADGNHGKGIGKSLYDVLFPILVELGYVNAFAGVTLPNPGSVGLHQKFGFETVGTYRKIGFKNGEWLDTMWLQKQLQAHPEYPADPKKLSDLTLDL